jgi:hypothetical protein
MADSTKNHTDRILSITGTAIAIAAFGLSFWNGCATRYHNRLSVKPRLYISAQRTDEESQRGLVLSNKGPGPALVKNWTISVDKRPVGSMSNGWLQALKQLQMEKPFVHFYSTAVLQSGEVQPILSISREQWARLSPEDQQAFNQMLTRIKVVIEYESVYEERDECSFDGSTDWILKGGG